jgi:hypothetical protein
MGWILAGNVARRTGEIGITMALERQRGGVVRMIQILPRRPVWTRALPRGPITPCPPTCALSIRTAGGRRPGKVHRLTI